MRRYLVTRSFHLPWSRRDAPQNETSPLIPKAKGGAVELTHVATDDGTGLQQVGRNSGQKQNNHACKRSQPHHNYSLSDFVLKYILFMSNLLFTALGLTVLGLGLWGLINKESFAQERIGSIGTDPMLIFVAVGLVLTVLCLSGCVGALRENCSFLRLFSSVMLVLITTQVIAAIVVYSLQGQIGGYLRSGMLAAIVRYQDDLDLRFITDEIQSGLQCCGADNYRDWEINIYYNCSAPGVLACGVPATCCVDPLENGTVWNSQCGLGAQRLDEFSAQSVIFLGGCLGGMSRWIEHHMGLIGTAGIIIVGVQILTLLITTHLLNRIQWHRANSACSDSG